MRTCAMCENPEDMVEINTVLAANTYICDECKEELGLTCLTCMLEHIDNIKVAGYCDCDEDPHYHSDRCYNFH